MESPSGLNTAFLHKFDNRTSHVKKEPLNMSLTTNTNPSRKQAVKGTIIIPCLDSHEVVRRQLLWLDSWMKPFSKEWNLIIVDDGSSPKISIASPTNFTVSVIHIPPHPEKWTQPRARNVGTKHTNTEFLLFTDIRIIFD